MLTIEASPTPSGDLRRSGRRAVAVLVVLALTVGAFAARALPVAASDDPTNAPPAEIGVTPVRVEAENYTGDNNGDVVDDRVMNTGVERHGGASGGSRVKNTFNGAEIWFDQVDLGTTPLSTLTLRYTVHEGRSGVNPSIDVFLDEKSDATRVATMDLGVTGSDWDSYGETTVDLLQEVSGEHRLIVVMHVDPKPGQGAGYPNYVGNIDYLELGPEPLPESFLTTADAWKYSDDGTDPSGDGSLSWTTADFDDSAWAKAVGSFGSKRGGAELGGGFVANTLLQYTLDGSASTVPTYHFRNEFAVSRAQLAQLESLQGTITYDDAVRIYVNGEKVAGFVDDRVDGAENQNVTYAGASNGDPRTSTFTIPAAALEPGENAVSVALYQDRETSSDIYLDLTSLVPAVEPAAPTISDIALHVGATEAERNLTWYSDVDVVQGAQLAKATEVVDGEFPASASTVDAEKSGETTSGEFFRDVTLSGLEESTEYAYRVGSDETGWSDISTFRTQRFSGDFSFLLFGDPQVGASGDLGRDEAGWIDTMNVATQSYPDAELLFSAGDQVETASSEAQYDAFLKPEQVRSIPLVVTNGNHDVGSKAYEQHFNVPNEDLESGAASNGTSSGGDYWFLYKDVLFVNINSNSRDFASHRAFMEQVVAEHGDEARWKVLAFHHSIYSVAAHTDDSDIIDRRDSMPADVSELGFDMVLMGHDHSYTRSHLIDGGELADTTAVAGQERVEAADGDVLYITANSASGSKYYDVRAPEAWFASVINQEKVRNYSAIEVTDETLTVRTLRSQANGTAGPVNSVVDEVVLARAGAATDLDVSVEASTRVVAGKQYVSTVVTNNEDLPVDVVVETPYGTKSFTAVQPGRSASVSMNSRETSIPAGEVTVTVTGQVGEETVTRSQTASYPAAG
ncbi:fibronectin type III domain-containing protein [Isoptericola halotolerans]|uniref:fibronectin type III domain-containing protein n=1 Tax=Isoptericola halotolerans TaxID=300560 RepID=UPI00389060A8